MRRALTASFDRAARAAGSASSWRAGAVALCLFCVALPAAQAGLFDDDEARKAILDLRARATANEEALRTQQAKATEAADQLRRSLLDLNGQIEALKAEIARLRGTEEQLARDVADVQRAQKDLGQGVSERMAKLEPQKVTLDGKDFVADPEEKRQYDEALGVLRSGDFVAASASLGGFVKRFPASGYADSARFWLGNALYGKRDYREAIASFRSFLAAAPQSPRAPEALLAVANTQVEMKDARSARATLNELLRNYPSSEAAQAGRERLASLK